MVRLCQAKVVSEGRPVRVEVEGFPPLAVYRVQDRFFVTDDTCTHSNASLSEGEQDGSTIICPIHEGVFDLETGEAIGFPCTRRLATYAVDERQGWICLDERSDV